MMLTVKHKGILIKTIIAILIIVFIVAYFNKGIISDITNILIASFILAYILKPIKNFIARKIKVKVSTISIFIILGLLTLFVIILYLIIPILYKEINNLGPIIDNAIGFFENLEQKSKIGASPLISFIYEELRVKLSNYLVIMSNILINGLISISENITSIAVIPVVTYYFLADSKRISNKLLLMVPLKKRNIVRKIIKDSDKLLGKYILGQLVLSLIVGILTFVVLIIFKVKFPIGLAALNGIFNIIPYFGPLFGGVPVIFIAFLDSTSKGIYVAISIFILQQIEGNILAPKITGDTTDMHPIIIIILLLIGEKFGGLIGMVIAVPIGVIIKVIYEDIDYYLF